MAGKSEIHWTDYTWNPVTGCSKVSPGCEHCYAEAISLRFKRSTKPWTYPNAAENVVLHPERMDEPFRWRKPGRVFTNSMSDLFHERVPDQYIADVFSTMHMAKQHTFQVLTKRPERMLALAQRGFLIGIGDRDSYPPNVWLGVSVEDQRRADERIPLLLETPAAVRFLSCEPLLEAVDLGRACWGEGHPRPPLDIQARQVGALNGDYTQAIKALDWVITGGESGPGRRPFDEDWARSIRDQCQAAGVAYFHKQGSGPRPGMNRELDGQLWEQYPEQRA